MATADAGDTSTELEPPPLSLKSPVWQYFGFPVSYDDNVRVRQKSHSLQALQKLDGRFILLNFRLTEYISYCYIMLLINVLNLTM